MLVHDHRQPVQLHPTEPDHGRDVLRPQFTGQRLCDPAGLEHRRLPVRRRQPGHFGLFLHNLPVRLQRVAGDADLLQRQPQHVRDDIRDAGCVSEPLRPGHRDAEARHSGHGHGLPGLPHLAGRGPVICRRSGGHCGQWHLRGERHRQRGLLRRTSPARLRLLYEGGRFSECRLRHCCIVFRAARDDLAFWLLHILPAGPGDRQLEPAVLRRWHSSAADAAGAVRRPGAPVGPRRVGGVRPDRHDCVRRRCGRPQPDAHHQHVLPARGWRAADAGHVCDPVSHQRVRHNCAVGQVLWQRVAAGHAASQRVDSGALPCPMPAALHARI